MINICQNKLLGRKINTSDFGISSVDVTSEKKMNNSFINMNIK